MRANHPARPLALWLRMTALVRVDGSAMTEAWCVFFDGEAATTWAAKAGIEGVGGAGEPRDRGEIVAGACRMRLAETAGEADGQLTRRPGDAASWQIRWQATPTEVAAPLCMLPTRRLLRLPFPRSKLLTPGPVLGFSGTFELGDRRHDLEGWIGSQGHNWGASHAREYVWTQITCPDSAGRAAGFAEAFCGRIAIGPWSSPRLSSLVIRREHREYRFDALLDPAHRRQRIGDMSWVARFRGRAGEAALAVEARRDAVVRLGYANPDGSVAVCRNSKLAHAHLRVDPVDEDSFELRSDHCAALEMLGHDSPLGDLEVA